MQGIVTPFAPKKQDYFGIFGEGADKNAFYGAIKMNLK